MFWSWAPGALFGIVLYLAIKRWNEAFILPISVALLIGAYRIVLAAQGISGEEAWAEGLLFASTSDGGLWPALLPSDPMKLDWSAMASQIPSLMTPALVALVCFVMNLAGLELAAKEDLDRDREFAASGLAGMVAGAGGGTVAAPFVPASLRSKLVGAASRHTGLFAAIFIGSALFAGNRTLELVPS
ncbi:MAG: SulP family inorganic anion transporter [Albidovulum sp.]|nr:SulP family inorganic anion transporter [Albidovulum sp.]